MYDEYLYSMHDMFHVIHFYLLYHFQLQLEESGRFVLLAELVVVHVE